MATMILGATFVFIFGLLIGSFLNVVILRLPHGQTLLGRSMCPHCKYILRPIDLVPIFSFLYLRGRCRLCAKPISWRYPLLEFLVASLYVTAYVIISPTDFIGYLLLLQVLVAVAVCVATFVIDLEHYLILDVVTLAGVGLVLCIKVMLAIFDHQVVWSTHSFIFTSFLGVLAGFVPFFLLWFFSRGKLMGFGDVKFMVFAGLVLGWPVIVVALLLAFWLGALVSMPLLFLRKKNFQSKLPFGTFLAIAVVIALLWGNSLWSWYVSLLGVR